MRFVVTLVLCGMLFGAAWNNANAQADDELVYPHLVSEKVREDDSYVCPIKPEEAKWLEEQLAAGTLRLAKADDIKAWEALAKTQKENPAGRVLDCGRTFVVLKELRGEVVLATEERFSTAIVFIVSSEAPAPDVGRSNIPVYDLLNGGAYQGGICYNGKWQGIGKTSRDCEE